MGHNHLIDVICRHGDKYPIPVLANGDCLLTLSGVTAKEEVCFAKNHCARVLYGLQPAHRRKHRFTVNPDQTLDRRIDRAGMQTPNGKISTAIPLCAEQVIGHEQRCFAQAIGATACISMIPRAYGNL